ncbi:MAG: FAD:protein FMN transferase [Tannerellaceae bacterium]|jgi:thiamine biosynthesis lipoprotein|nr:FAD:protein FMN transferase [Tannerellaceae bacterium]
MKKFNIIFPLAICLLLFSACKDRKQYFEERGSIFHTLYTIKYEANTPLTDSIEAEFKTFNLSLNPFNPNSIISKINKNEPVDADDLFITVFNSSQEISAQTQGAFDATVAPLVNLWGFGFNKMDSVTPAMIDSIKTFVGWQKIHLNGRTVIKDDPRIMLNFSAIAKGYASDVIASLLERNGVENYMVEIGGEVTMKGINQAGNCWRIGINKPIDNAAIGSNDGIEEIFSPCKQCGLATSGDYRNFYEKDGKRYAHTINPSTGYPAAQNILSATIITTDCMTADGYATAFMVMGAEKAIETASRIPSIDYFLIYTDDRGQYKTACSNNIRSYMSKH